MFQFRVSTLLPFVLVAFSLSQSVAARYSLFHASRGATVVSSCVNPNHAALTFDDGPFQYTIDAINQLEAVGGKGTFFVNGNNWGCIYSEENVAVLKDVYSRGHQIASHTWSHSDLSTLSYVKVQSEMKKAHVAIERITGASVAFMRPPYGSYDDQVLAVAEQLGETVVIWDFDSGDSVGVSVADQKKRYDDLVVARPSNVMSLQHDVHETSITEVLPHAIQVLKEAGYQLVTLAECLGQKPYQKVGNPQSRNVAWRC